MRDLKATLDRAAEVAEPMSSNPQNAYTSQFNKQATYKSFQMGETILVFADQRTGKMFPKWKGPGPVVEKHREHPYFVEMPGGRKLVHASKLRPYQRRVSTVGVMFDADRAFGEVNYAPGPTDERSTGMVFPEGMTAHVGGRDRADIRAVFAAHKGLFKDKPGMAKLREHFIVRGRLRPKIVSPAPRACRITRGRWASRAMSSLKT